MNLSINQLRVKLTLVIIAAAIGIGSILSTNRLVKKISEEERKKIELWAEGTKQLSMLTNEDNQDISLILKVVKNNETVPVILTDEHGDIISSRNFDPVKEKNKNYLKKQLKLMATENDRIEINFPDGSKNFVYYKNSILLQKLFYYPFIQLGVITLFILIAYFAYSSSWRAEQNRVWVGMSKETAHQLGTPVSSLLAWLELLKEKITDSEILLELEKDINRLEKITARFSKIGSEPTLKKENIAQVLIGAVNYMKARSSEKIQFRVDTLTKGPMVPLNAPLFEWVVENLCKNAMDAMDGDGTITITLKNHLQSLIIDISDTGAGIPKSKFKTIFNPGYTTKKKGWGLGLSLSKRIIENYHAGKIFVKSSEINKGTTFRIIFKKIF